MHDEGSVIGSSRTKVHPAHSTGEIEEESIVFERLQFQKATANNGKRRAVQQYFRIIVELFAEVEDSPHAHGENQVVKIARCSSDPLIVRGRSPGHYQHDWTHQGENLSYQDERKSINERVDYQYYSQELLQSTRETVDSNELKGSHTSTNSDLDTASIGSVDSIFSQGLNSISTEPSISHVPEIASEQILVLLSSDNILQCNYEIALQRMTSQKFETNFARMLRHYSRDLRLQARTPQQVEVTRILRREARAFARRISQGINMPIERAKVLNDMIKEQPEKEIQLERFLSHYEPHVEMKFEGYDNNIDSELENDSDDEDEYGETPNVARLESFLLDGAPFAQLRNRLSNLLTSTEDENSEPREQRKKSTREHLPLPMLKHFASKYLFHFRSSVRPLQNGHRRIKWICVCALFITSTGTAFPLISLTALGLFNPKQF